MRLSSCVLENADRSPFSPSLGRDRPLQPSSTLCHLGRIEACQLQDRKTGWYWIFLHFFHGKTSVLSQFQSPKPGAKRSKRTHKLTKRTHRLTKQLKQSVCAKTLTFTVSFLWTVWVLKCTATIIANPSYRFKAFSWTCAETGNKKNTCHSLWHFICSYFWTRDDVTYLTWPPKMDQFEAWVVSPFLRQNFYNPNLYSHIWL